MKATLLAAAALAALPFQIGCDFETLADAGERYREEFAYTYDLNPGARITVENFNGSVEILSWEKDAIQISGSKWASHREDLPQIRIDVQAGADGVRIRTIRPDGLRRNMGAKYFIRAPRRVLLESIRSSNGSIRVEDIEGAARLTTSNGAIRLRRIVGRVDAHTSNGSIEGDDIEGDATFETSNGSIRAARLRGAVQARTSNSSITIALSKPRPNEPLDFQSSNGHLDLTFEELANNEIRATTSNSSITVRLPGSVKAQLRANTSNSSITSDLDVTTHGAIGKGRLEGDINGGGPLIRLSTSNGRIRLARL